MPEEVSGGDAEPLADTHYHVALTDARAQIVEDGDDPFIFELLTRWRDKTGCNLILNTSFNCQEPLVDTVAHARSTWKRTGLDVLVSPEGIETEKSAPYELRSNPNQFPAIS